MAPPNVGASVAGGSVTDGFVVGGSVVGGSVVGGLVIGGSVVDGFVEGGAVEGACVDGVVVPSVGVVVGSSVGVCVAPVVPSVPSVKFSALSVVGWFGSVLGVVAWLLLLPQAARANSIDKARNSARIFFISLFPPSKKGAQTEVMHPKNAEAPIAATQLQTHKKVC